MRPVILIALTLCLAGFAICTIIAIALFFIIPPAKETTTSQIVLRQQTLYKNIVVAVKKMERDRSANKNLAATQNDIIKNFYIFDSTHEALLQGGNVTALNGKHNEMLHPIKTPDCQPYLENVSQLWNESRKPFIEIFQKGELTPAETISRSAKICEDNQKRIEENIQKIHQHLLSGETRRQQTLRDTLKTSTLALAALFFIASLICLKIHLTTR